MQPRDFLSEDNASPQTMTVDSPRDFLAGDFPENESLWTSIKEAPGRISEDVGKKALAGYQALPKYYHKALQELPAQFNLRNLVPQHPISAGKQALAGTNELINSIAQMPKNIAEYGANRLHLLPQGVSNFVSNISPEDTTQAIHNIFGEPKYPGEAFTRGVARNITPLGGTAALGSSLLGKVKNLFKETPKLPEAIMTGEFNPNIYPKSPYLSELEKDQAPADLGFLEQKPMEHPDVTAQNIMQDFSQGKRPHEAAATLAKDLKSSYETVKEGAANEFNKLFKVPVWNQGTVGNIKLYNFPDPLRGIKRKGEYIDTVGEGKKPYGNSDLNELHQELLSNPTVQKAHQLQTELGRKVGDLKYQNKMGNLDDAGKRDLSLASKARIAIRNDSKTAMGKVNKVFPEDYEKATQNWKNEVEPYHSEDNLRKIVNGDIQYPSRTNIESIFKDPEKSIQKVKNDIGPDSARRISYIGLNKLPEEFTAKDLTSAKKSLEKKGLSSYLHPEHEQSFSQLNERVNEHKANEEKIQQQKNLIADIQRQTNEINKHKAKLSSIAQKKYTAATKESKGMHKEKKNALLAEKNEAIKKQNALIDLKEARKQKGINTLKHLAAASIGGYSAFLGGKNVYNSLKE